MGSGRATSNFNSLEICAAVLVCFGYTQYTVPYLPLNILMKYICVLYTYQSLASSEPAQRTPSL